MKKIGLFGGSFDPIHIGHLWIAEEARERLGLEEVRFVPAAESPLKVGAQRAPDRARLEMLMCATQGNSAFRVDDRELRRGGVSYTVETLRELHAEESNREWYLIVGSDSLNDFEKWREVGEICRLAIPAVVTRAGGESPRWDLLSRWMTGERLEWAKASRIETASIEVSSRDIRARVQASRSIRYRVPAAVESMIMAGGWYGG